jgi:hypothetical protein
MKVGLSLKIHFMKMSCYRESYSSATHHQNDLLNASHSFYAGRSLLKIIIEKFVDDSHGSYRLAIWEDSYMYFWLMLEQC